MPSPLANIMARAAVIPLGNSGSPNGRRKLIKPRLGNQADPFAASKGQLAATQSITYTSQGQPLNIDWSAEEMARQAYMGQVYVQRGCRIIADTIAQLPWVAGPDPTDPSNYDKDASLASLLGPSTPQAPGGPNPRTPARVFWSWSIIQYLVTGRWAWEVEYDAPRTKNIVGLWPLVSAALAPIPSMKGSKWFDGFQYTPARGLINLPEDKVIYCWRPSIIDWRQSESPLQSASYPVYIANSINKYMANLLKNDLVATTLVVGPPIEEPEFRRAWQDQFLSKFTGVQNKGSTIFAEVEYDDDDTTNKPLIQIERLAQTPLDAGLLQMLEVAKEDINIALGVPKSMMGAAADVTFSNVDGEWRNFWTTTLLNLVTDIQDQVNQNLAPRLDDGANSGWFDLSNIEALQPSAVFAPPMITDAIQTGVASPEQIATLLNIPPQPNDPNPVPESNTDTVERSAYWHRQLQMRAVEYWLERRDQKVNTWTLRGERKIVEPTREHINVRAIVSKPKKATSGRGIRQAERITRRANDFRAMITADRTTAEVHQKLAKTYPESTLGWVDDADWSGPTKVDLSNIDMARRPGGRDQDKVKGIAGALAEDPDGPTGKPIVLVKTPGDGKLKIADGYHRTLAHERLDHSQVPAFIGKVDDDEGDWNEAMHDAKLNREDPLDLDVRTLEALDAVGDELALADL